MKKTSVFNQRGSIQYGIALLVVIAVVIVIFYFIDKYDTETEEFGYTRDPNRFDTSEEGQFFDEDEVPRSGQGDQNLVKPLEPVDESDLEEEKDPSELGKSPRNAFYNPPDPEERRRAEKKDAPPALRP